MHFTSIVGLLLLSVSTGQVLCLLEPELYSGYILAAAKSLQSWPALCDPTDGSPPGSAVPGILQARTLEWVAIAFSIA